MGFVVGLVLGVGGVCAGGGVFVGSDSVSDSVTDPRVEIEIDIDIFFVSTFGCD